MLETLNDYRGYYEGKFVGTADVELPELTWKSETTSGAGYMGDIDTIAVAHLEAMEATINFHTATEIMHKLSAPKTHELVFRASLQGRETARSRITHTPYRVTILAEPKSISLGKLETAAKMESGITMAVNYIEIALDDKVITKIDKLNYICVIDGVDYSEEIRQNIGM